MTQVYSHLTKVKNRLQFINNLLDSQAIFYIFFGLEPKKSSSTIFFLIRDDVPMYIAAFYISICNYITKTALIHYF